MSHSSCGLAQSSCKRGRVMGSSDSTELTAPWIIRTDFSDAERWRAIRDEIQATYTHGGVQFGAHVTFVDAHAYRGLGARAVIHALPDDYPQDFCFIVDGRCIRDFGHPILVVGMSEGLVSSEDLATFRAVPSQVRSIESNLSISNMDFLEFADAADGDGVFRGF